MLAPSRSGRTRASSLRRTLSSSRPATWAVVLTSVFFGALHLFSQSPAQGAFEKVLFAVGAVALGFVCAVARLRTGALWAAVGVHSGFYLGEGFFPTEPTHFGVQLAAQIVITTVLGLAVLGFPGRRGAARRVRPDA
jgi:uncharacterized protein